MFLHQTKVLLHDSTCFCISIKVFLHQKRLLLHFLHLKLVFLHDFTSKTIAFAWFCMVLQDFASKQGDFASFCMILHVFACFCILVTANFLLNKNCLNIKKILGNDENASYRFFFKILNFLVIGIEMFQNKATKLNSSLTLSVIIQ